jgi:hypothetical protein
MRRGHYCTFDHVRHYSKFAENFHNDFWPLLFSPRRHEEDGGKKYLCAVLVGDTIGEVRGHLLLSHIC